MQLRERQTKFGRVREGEELFYAQYLSILTRFGYAQKNYICSTKIRDPDEHLFLCSHTEKDMRLCDIDILYVKQKDLEKTLRKESGYCKRNRHNKLEIGGEIRDGAIE